MLPIDLGCDVNPGMVGTFHAEHYVSQLEIYEEISNGSVRER
jgi:hypothetical protein